MEVRFLYFTQSGKMLIPVDCHKSHMYIVIYKATSTKVIQRDTMKNTTKNQEVILKNVQVTHRKARKEKEETRTRGNKLKFF